MLTPPVLRATGIALGASLAALLLAPTPAGATSSPQPVTALISVATNGKAGNKASTAPVPSSGGRFVAFTSTATDLVAGDTNGVSDVFVRDTLAATTVRASVSTKGAQASGPSIEPSISANGRFVAFTSAATDLVAGDTNAAVDVFVRDLRLGTTVRASVKVNGAAQSTGGNAGRPTISDDGNVVAFLSASPNLVDFDLNGQPDVFVRDLAGGSTELVSLTSGEVPLTVASNNPSMSGTGRYVVFDSATTQIGADANNHRDVFLRDRLLGTTERVSIASNGAASDGDSKLGVVSYDGRYVSFESLGSNLTTDDDAPAFADVYRRDRTSSTTILISRASGNGEAGDKGGQQPTASADGNRIAFASDSDSLINNDTGVAPDVYLRDVLAKTLQRSDEKVQGPQVEHPELGKGASLPRISTDGTAVDFASTDAEVCGTDGNAASDAFSRSTFEIGPFGASAFVIEANALAFNGTPMAAGSSAALDLKIRCGTASPESTIDDLAHGTFDDHRGPVMRLYWSFFHRMPDAGGLNYWVGKHAGGTTLRQIANTFAKSSEFSTKYGSLDDSHFVTLVYQNVLERNPDAAGLSHWVGRLAAGVSRGEMMTGFSESSEGARKMRGEVDTVLVFLGMLHRLPTAGEFTSDVAVLEGSGGQVTEVLIRSILTSPAYAATVN